MGNNEYYEQVLRILLHLHNSPLKALPIGNEKWYEIDDVQDLDIASCIFSKKDVRWKEYHRRYGGYWRFPQMLDFCYLVNLYYPPEKLKDELRANFDVLFLLMKMFLLLLKEITLWKYIIKMYLLLN